MNNKTHFLLFVIFSAVVLYICRKAWLKEPFGNQIIIHPDGSFDPQETTFSVLTYDSDLSSGYTQVATCSDNNDWTNGDKTCRDYSLVGSDCSDIGDDGKSALEACKVACDNCDTYTEITRRIPSPVEDTEEPSYSAFQGQGSEGEMDGVGSREMIEKLGEMTDKLSAFELAYGVQAQSISELTDELDARFNAYGAASAASARDSDWGAIGTPETQGLKYISIGKDKIWGIGNGDSIRDGGDPPQVNHVYQCENTATNPCLGDWTPAPGVGSFVQLKQLDAGEREVWGVSSATGSNIGDMLYNKSNTEIWNTVAGALSEGDTVPAPVEHVSVGKDAIWVIAKNPDGQRVIKYCKDPDCDQNSEWTTVTGSETLNMKQLDAGQSQVWGVSDDGLIHKRSVRREQGPFTPVDGPAGDPTIGHISVGKDWVWAVSSEQGSDDGAPGQIYKCAHPCTGDWVSAGNANGGGELSQLDASWWNSDNNAFSEEVWGLNPQSTNDYHVYRKQAGLASTAEAEVTQLRDQLAQMTITASQPADQLADQPADNTVTQSQPQPQPQPSQPVLLNNVRDAIYRWVTANIPTPSSGGSWVRDQAHITLGSCEGTQANASSCSGSPFGRTDELETTVESCNNINDCNYTRGNIDELFSYIDQGAAAALEADDRVAPLLEDVKSAIYKYIRDNTIVLVVGPTDQPNAARRDRGITLNTCEATAGTTPAGTTCSGDFSSLDNEDKNTESCAGIHESCNFVEGDVDALLNYIASEVPGAALPAVIVGGDSGTTECTGDTILKHTDTKNYLPDPRPQCDRWLKEGKCDNVNSMGSGDEPATFYGYANAAAASAGTMDTTNLVEALDEAGNTISIKDACCETCSVQEYVYPMKTLETGLWSIISTPPSEPLRGYILGTRVNGFKGIGYEKNKIMPFFWALVLPLPMILLLCFLLPLCGADGMKGRVTSMVLPAIILCIVYWGWASAGRWFEAGVIRTDDPSESREEKINAEWPTVGDGGAAGIAYRNRLRLEAEYKDRLIVYSVAWYLLCIILVRFTTKFEPGISKIFNRWFFLGVVAFVVILIPAWISGVFIEQKTLLNEGDIEAAMARPVEQRSTSYSTAIKSDFTPDVDINRGRVHAVSTVVILAVVALVVIIVVLISGGGDGGGVAVAVLDAEAAVAEAAAAAGGGGTKINWVVGVILSLLLTIIVGWSVYAGTRS